MPAKFNVARSGVSVQCLGRTGPAQLPLEAILCYKKYPKKEVEKLYLYSCDIFLINNAMQIADIRVS